jgi:RAT1-interacting protein
LRILRNKLTSVSTTVLKTAVTEEGVYRIRRREKSGVIEVFKIEEQGTGKILSDEFLQWRQQLLAKQVATVAQLLQ